MHGCSGTKAEDGIWKGASIVVSALAKEEDCSSSEGTVVSSGGAGGDCVGCTGEEGAELQKKAPRPCLGKPEGLGDWTLQRKEAQGSTRII